MIDSFCESTFFRQIQSGYTVKKKGLKYYKCGVKGCGTNVSAKELHSKYAEILNGLNVPESLLPIYKRVIERKFK